MEGFLQKKGKGETTFGRKNWKKRWFILERSKLSYYEDFDQSINGPINLKGVIDVTGCKIEQSKDKKFAFDLVHPEKPPFSMLASDQKQCSCNLNLQSNNYTFNFS